MATYFDRSKVSNALILLGCFSIVVLLLPFSVEAQVCANFTTSISPSYELPGRDNATQERYNDLPPATQDYSVTIPETGRSVSFDITATMNTNVFTKIYTNLLSMVPFVATVNDYVVTTEYANQPDILAKWQRYYCMGALDEVRQGSTSVRMTGTFIDEEEEEEERPCRPDEIAAGLIDCYDTETVRYSVNADQTEPGNTRAPNYSGPYEIAKKLAWTLKEQYCNPDDPQAACINSNFVCDTTRVPPKGDPLAKGKTGTCVFQAYGFDRNANVMCTDVTSSLQALPPQMLQSRICAYGGYRLRPEDPNALPRISSGSVGQEDGSNSLPFDAALFSNNGEATNNDCTTGGENCFLDGYFRSSVGNKLSHLTYDDLKKIEAIPARFDAEYDTGGDVDDGNSPWTSDYVDRLGGIEYISEEARNINPHLLKSGSSVMVEGDHMVSTRLNNSDGGILHFDNIPVGLRKDSAGNDITGIQHPPTISKQISGRSYIVMTPIAVAQDIFIPYFFISEGDRTPPPLMSIPGGSITRQAPYRAFLNSKGDAVFLAQKDGALRYITYYTAPSGQKVFGSSWTEVSPRFRIQARFAIDSADNIHVIGTDADGTNVLNYGKYSFKDASRGLELVNETAIAFPRAMSSFRSALFSIQTDNDGAAHILANIGVADAAKAWHENDIHYVKVHPNSNVGNIEVAVRASEDYASKYMYGRPEGFPGLYNDHKLSMYGSSITAHNGFVFIAYINDNYSDSSEPGLNFGHAYQAAYAIRKPDGTWIQNYKLSDRVAGDYAYLTQINLSRYGELAFTVVDKANKYDEKYKTFDGAGRKMCLFTNWNNFFSMALLEQESYTCGYSGPSIKHVLSPSSTASSGQMQFVDFPKLPFR